MAASSSPEVLSKGRGAAHMLPELMLIHLGAVRTPSCLWTEHNASRVQQGLAGPGGGGGVLTSGRQLPPPLTVGRSWRPRTCGVAPPRVQVTKHETQGKARDRGAHSTVKSAIAST